MGNYKTKRGYYEPVNKEKYIQPKDDYMNSKEFPEYRSSWELHLYKFCDISPAVEYWSTEYISIPYLSPKDDKMHRYYPDVFIIFKSGDKYIIEVKPYKEKFINENKRKNDKMIMTYQINQCKWAAAKEYAEENGYKFVVMTEKDLGV